MDAKMGEIVLLMIIGGLILLAAVREVLMFARWINDLRRFRLNRD
jgi:hypothetical protein